MSTTTLVRTDWMGLPSVEAEANGYSVATQIEEVSVDKLDREYHVYERPLTIVKKIRRSYAEFPVITSVFHALAVVGVLGLFSFAVWGFEPVHPYAFFWLTVASVGMSSVIWTAAGDLGGKK